MSCTTCYKIKIDNCAESVTVAGELLPDTNYTWVITDKFGHEWSYVVTTDENGSFTIDLTDPMFPAGLFNQFSNLTLEVFLYETQCEAAEMTFCEQPYTCVNFSVNPGNYVYTPPPPPDEVMTCCFEDILYDDIQELILNDDITEGMMYRITDATEYTINLIVTGLSTSAVTGEAYSQEFPQDEIFYDIANDVITRRTDTIKKLSAPFDWRNKIHTIYRRKFNAEAIGFPCVPVSYSYDGFTVTVGNPDAATAGMTFNDMKDVLVWLQTLSLGLACRVDGVDYSLALYSISPFDQLYGNFTLNDGTDKILTFVDDEVEFYTFGNSIQASGSNTDLMVSAANGNGGNCYNIFVTDSSVSGLNFTTVIGDSVRDIVCGAVIINDGAYNIQIPYESDKSYFFNSSGGGYNIIANIGSIYQNSEYGGSPQGNINAGLLNASTCGYESYNYGNSYLTKRYATERLDNSLGIYDYRAAGIGVAFTTFIIDFTQTVNRITDSYDALGSSTFTEIILKPTAGNTLTLTATAVGALANSGEIICEDGTITLDGSNFDYAVLESFLFSGQSYWRVKEYHNY